MSAWGRELLWPDEVAYEDGRLGWLSREEVPDEEEARRVAADQLRLVEQILVEPENLRLTAVLMREESEVEANINGHEFPLMVECTARAKHPEPFWRVERASEEAGAARQGEAPLEREGNGDG